MNAVQHTQAPAPEQAIDLSQAGRVDRQTILQQLNQAFAFPEYFGDNWDAAYDLLMDKIDLSPPQITWHFYLPNASDLNLEDLQTFQQLLEDLVRYATQRQKRLKVWLHTPT
ncbi:barstar family protein [Nitrincola tapanii]|uniref:Barstar (barnase inhibitor) domain-containing protein n=1 Tax=Nitrincola tapanii TaxID=1708751 RepID=A0A5A9W685_9GAMM|nr:barstar family protein [Nitrincola tapanii]KAA0876287.1 hypothetical protein E1H14_00700 [Nitrincola tapanii]